MEQKDLLDLRFEMCCLNWFPRMYANDTELSKTWCEFSNEIYIANELVIRPHYVIEFKKWYEKRQLEMVDMIMGVLEND